MFGQRFVCVPPNEEYMCKRKATLIRQTMVTEGEYRAREAKAKEEEVFNFSCDFL